LNKGLLTPLLLSMLAVMMVVPETPSLLVHGAGTASLAVDPSLVGADIGSTFTVGVDVGNVASLTGTDIILHYSNTVLSAVSINCAGADTIYGTPSHFVAACSASNNAMTAESAVALLGGTPLAITTPRQVMSVTFKVIAFGGSDLTIDTQSKIAAFSNGVTISVPYSVSNGAFVTPPNILAVAPNGTVASGERVRRLSSGQTFVDLVGFIQLAPNAPQAAFGGLIFDVIAPDGTDTAVTSNIIFLSIGASGTVGGTYNFGAVTGTYRIFVTPIRCTLPDQCVAGTTTYSGLFFKVKS
jgi:hypothetical protein